MFPTTVSQGVTSAELPFSWSQVTVRKEALDILFPVDEYSKI